MGITGLIPFMAKASTRINIKDLRGCTIAVDTYCWLHKGAIGCADQLSRGIDTDFYVKYCLKYVKLLLSHNIKPILVFDGQHLQAKALTESRRREIRKKSKSQAAELLLIGRIDEARSHMKRCIDITHEMVLKLIKECRKMNVDCIVAPYEADAQLAYLNKCGIAQYVITEDSDLALFGCKKIIFKLELLTGNGLLVDSDKYYLTMGCRPEKYTLDKFRYMCILSGCDYLDSLPGIGLAKACKFICMIEETDDIQKYLPKIPFYLKMSKLVVCEEYIEGFLKADATFKHMYVFDPMKRRMVRLNELSEFGTDEELCSNAGEILNEETAFQLALGNLNPLTLEKLDDWNPDDHFSKLKEHNKKSIWALDFKSDEPKKNTYDIRCAFKFKRIDFALEDGMSQTDVTVKQSESEVLSLYSPEEYRKRRRSSNSSVENHSKQQIISESPSKSDDNTHNPFMKSRCSDSQNIPSSLLNSISPTERKIENNDKDTTKSTKIKKIIKSRLFPSNLVLVKASDENDVKKNEVTEIKNFNEIIKDVEEAQLPNTVETPDISQIKITEQTEGVENKKSSFNDVEDQTVSHENKEHTNPVELIDLDAYKISNEKTHKISSSVKKTNKVLRIGLSRPKAQKVDKNQSRLSMFGFEKRSSLTHN